ncbi:transporter substrate-binding domain-containing protein [Legionella cardiaca]|uniref:Transporter substrate-binding domain-containing protein n=1 Tax=Legionella cardiaca TaxID=1071983 RepID=A0ABY8AQQ2_9GAMM|nr:transporter substrate-binding domain-containing protein [Legionella cardiaca]WED42106.1 transporter substrate-binding domain-containing protein [Legionella cardiaca]
MSQVKILLLFFCLFTSFSGYSNIKIGTLTYDPPFIISATQGFDIELSGLLCKYLQEECQLIPKKNSTRLYKALQNQEVDLAIAGITISQSRKSDFIFSLPYLLTKSQFLTLKNSNIDSIEDLKNTTVGVIRDELSGGVLYHYLVNNYQGQFKINQYDDVEDLLDALNNKTLSAVFLYRSDVVYWHENGGNSFKPMAPVVMLGEGIAIMALPQKIKLIERINKVLLQMEKDDIYLRLYKTYFSNN